MTAIQEGQHAPEFMLPDTRGVPFVLRECLSEGPSLLVFFEVSCPASRTLLAFLQRMHTRYATQPGLADEAFRVVAVSLDSADETADLVADLGLTYTVAVESAARDTARAYGVRCVPTMVLVETDGRVALRSEGFARRDFEEVARRCADTHEVLPYAMFDPDEEVPERMAATPVQLDP